MEQYREMFVAECRELLQELNTLLLDLENAPDDGAVIDEIFRMAHSFKGSAGTMEYDAMAGLTHEMEAVLDFVRSGDLSVSPDMVTLLLECVDSLERAVNSVETDGTEGIDPSSLIARLQVAGSGDAPAAAAAQDGDAAESAAHEPAAPDVWTHRIDVTFAEDCFTPDIRSWQAVNVVAKHGDVVVSQPQEHELETWDGAGTLHVWIDGLASEADLLGELHRVGEVGTIELVAREEPADVQPLAVVPPVSDLAPAAELVVTKLPDMEEPAAAVAGSAEPNGRRAALARRTVAGTIRVEAERLDSLMNTVGEVLLHRTTVESFLRDGDLAAARESMQDLRRASQTLQTEVMNVRMVPVGAAFGRIPRLVRDLANRLGKQVAFEVDGQETEIDRSVVDALSDPLVHLVRNALDHGIEQPDIRTDAGKAAEATLRISARHAGSNVLIEISDDGAGIDAQRVARKAAEAGLITAAEVDAIDIATAIELLFAPGFSTADEATDISGRGVGMDAVRAACRDWGGDVQMRSVPGEGTTVSVRIPLTLAIMTVLVVTVDGQPLALPMDRVERTIRLADHTVFDAAGGQLLELDGNVLPVLELARSVGFPPAKEEARFGVVVDTHAGRAVLKVTGLIGEQETVTKPLPPSAGDGFMGACIQSNGDVLLIVDCDLVTQRGEQTTSTSNTEEGAMPYAS